MIRARVSEAIVKACWELPPERIRELSGLPELSDELIQHRIDMCMQDIAPWLFEDGAAGCGNASRADPPPKPAPRDPF